MYCLKNFYTTEEVNYFAYNVEELQEIALSIYEEIAYGWYNEFVNNPETYRKENKDALKCAYEYAYDEVLDWVIFEGILIV